MSDSTSIATTTETEAPKPEAPKAPKGKRKANVVEAVKADVAAQAKAKQVADTEAAIARAATYTKAIALQAEKITDAKKRSYFIERASGILDALKSVSRNFWTIGSACIEIRETFGDKFYQKFRSTLTEKLAISVTKTNECIIRCQAVSQVFYKDHEYLAHTLFAMFDARGAMDKDTNDLSSTFMQAVEDNPLPAKKLGAEGAERWCQKFIASFNEYAKAERKQLRNARVDSSVKWDSKESIAALKKTEKAVNAMFDHATSSDVNTLVKNFLDRAPHYAFDITVPKQFAKLAEHDPAAAKNVFAELIGIAHNYLSKADFDKALAKGMEYFKVNRAGYRKPSSPTATADQPAVQA